MEGSQPSFNFKRYGLKHIKSAVSQSIRIVDDARNGLRDVLPTKWDRLNKNLLGGLQKGKLYVIGGRPGSGKSAISNQMLFDILDIAMIQGKNVVVFYWSFEMPGYQQVMRSASKDAKMQMMEMLSVDGRMGDVGFDAYRDAVNKFNSYPIYFNERPRNVQYIFDANESYCIANPSTTVINLFDHSRLVKGKDRQQKELEKLVDLSHTCMDIQAKMGAVNIILSQLNRNIESNDRARTQYQPLLSDLFGSDSIGQDAHVVMLINRPNDMYKITDSYCGEDPKGLMAVHMEKNRDGLLGMIPFDANMANFTLKERAKK